MSTSPRTSGPVDAVRDFVGVVVRPRTYCGLAYLLVCLPLGFAYLAGTWAGVALGLGYLSTLPAPLTALAALPILGFAVAGATPVADFEAALASRFVDAGIDRSGRSSDHAGDHSSPPEGSALDAPNRPRSAPPTWRSFLAVVLAFCFALVSLALLSILACLALAMLAAPLLYTDPAVDYRFGGFVADTLPETVIVAVAGLFLALSALHLCDRLGRAGGELTAALLDADRLSHREPPDRT